MTNDLVRKQSASLFRQQNEVKRTDAHSAIGIRTPAMPVVNAEAGPKRGEASIHATDRPPGRQSAVENGNHKPMSQPTKSQPTKSPPTMSSPTMSSPIMSSPKPTLQKYHVYHQTQNHPDHGHLEYKMPALKPAEAMKITPVSRWLD